MPDAGDVAALWGQAAAAAARWLAAQSLAAEDAVVLVPFAALLPVARQRFAETAPFQHWPPRVETTLTLAASLGPPPAGPSGGVSGVSADDRLVASVRVRRLVAAGELTAAQGDVDTMVALCVDAAQRLRAAALAMSPSARPLFWALVSERLGAMAAGPAQAEARLLREALAWCAQGVVAATDHLFAGGFGAWIAVELGGADVLARGVLEAQAAQGAPTLRIVADAEATAPFAALAQPARMRRWLCEDAEDEARAAAAAVMEALEAGRTPVALVALDRSLLRRTCALLQRVGVPLRDETGWQLSTTRAAARLMSLLRAAQAQAGSDAWLDWLATWPQADPAARVSLEALWRGRRRVPDPEAAGRLAREAAAFLEPLAAPPGRGRRSLREWLRRLSDRLAADGSGATLAAEQAGAQVLSALRLDQVDDGWGPAADAVPMDLAEFSAWVAAALEDARFDPLSAPGAEVVVTPLARAIGRPFAQVVVPAADHRHLGQPTTGPSLIGEALAAEFGLGTMAQARLRQRLALGHLMRAPALTWLRRRQDEGEDVGDSPDLEWLLLEAVRRGEPSCSLVPAPVTSRRVQAVAVAPPMARVADALPAALSATQVEALRDCPYRFFARAVLRLEEATELDVGLAKRDYGEWLHLVLHRFHLQRAASEAAADGSDDAARLQRAAEQATIEQALDEAELLPFRASFEVFAPAYLDWLAQREAQGWHWLSGESDERVAPPALAPTVLRGRLDRVDVGPGGARQVIDYKTGNADALRRKAGDPMEDTQLAFYAALLGNATPLSACYLALDGRDAPREIGHADVRRTASALVDGLAGELRRLRAGEPLQALGEGEVCDRCETRGLCRRDHWLRPAAPGGTA